MPLMGGQQVKIRWEIEGNGNLSGWYGGADFAHAKRVNVPASGSRTVNITLS
jgi:hypothetical protein